LTKSITLIKQGFAVNGCSNYSARLCVPSFIVRRKIISLHDVFIEPGFFWGYELSKLFQMTFCQARCPFGHLTPEKDFYWLPFGCLLAVCGLGNSLVEAMYPRRPAVLTITSFKAHVLNTHKIAE